MKFTDFFKKIKHTSLKVYRRLYAPIYMKRMNKRIAAAKRNHPSEVNLDELFLDTRESVDTDLEKIKNIAVKVLKMIDYLSKKHDFNYFLGYGTLLGAIRHKGFIPWDDDIDIMMTRKDLDKLISVSHELPPSIKTFACGLDFVKVMDLYSKMSFDGKRGVAVDIFIVDDRQETKFSFLNVHSLKTLTFDRSDFMPLIWSKFETESFPIPKESDKILTTIYGDYMKLPPVEKRVSHHSNNKSIKISKFPSNKERGKL